MSMHGPKLLTIYINRSIRLHSRKMQIALFTCYEKDPGINFSIYVLYRNGLFHLFLGEQSIVSFLCIH